jgi:SAM-dependent methyltransferase
MTCRHCGAGLDMQLLDLGSAPPSNAYLTAENLNRPEAWYPLRVLVCTRCWLVQTADVSAGAVPFDAEYAYFSSFSSSWLKHASEYVDMMTGRFGLTSESLVIEVAANDGYLLQFLKTGGIPCIGIEPTASTAAAARAKGLTIIEEFFGQALAATLAKDGMRADLMVANNVLAHVPDINDFVRAFAYCLKEDGVATFEFPHLVEMIDGNQFDTIYYEHYSYLSLTAVTQIFENNGLHAFDVERLSTHGGSLRVFAQRQDTGRRPRAHRVVELLQEESDRGVATKGFYAGFQYRSDTAKNAFLSFLLEARRRDSRVAAYGAAAKGNTLMNFAGVRKDLILFVVDRNPAKQGKFMPGSRIPIVAEERLLESRPDYVVILPWNLRHEIVDQLSYARDWGASFVTAVPDLLITQ